MTLPQLTEHIASTVQKAEPKLMSHVFNIREWLLPSLNGIHNHLYPHVYRIFRSAGGKVQLKYKNWSTEETWLPQHTDEQLELFKLGENGQQCIPRGSPVLVEPDMNRKQNLEVIKGNIERMKSFLSFQEYEWWKSFLENPSAQPDQTKWYIENWLPQANDEEREESRHADNVVSPEDPLHDLMLRERQIPQLYTGKRRKKGTGDKQPRASMEGQETETRQKRNQAGPSNGEPSDREQHNRYSQPKYVVGDMAVAKFGEDVIIGEIVGVLEDQISLRMFSGNMEGKWKPVWRGEKEMVVSVNRQDICADSNFKLTKSNCLPTNIRIKVREYMQECSLV